MALQWCYGFERCWEGYGAGAVSVLVFYEQIHNMVYTGTRPYKKAMYTGNTILFCFCNNTAYLLYIFMHALPHFHTVLKL